MSVKVITKYVASDGQEFNSAQEAEEHNIDTEIRSGLKRYFSDWPTLDKIIENKYEICKILKDNLVE